jgi:hypothetical protein
VAGYLEDLDELILKCRNKNAREYIREAVASYRAEAYRASIVSCWVAVCYDLIAKLRELALAGDKQAERKIEELEAIHRDNDTSRSLKFEREILAFARDEIELISALEHEDLDRILRDRHRCAHPSLNAEGEQYSPPAELARLHIHSAVTHLLQHEPAQGRFALDRLISQVWSKYFPTDAQSVLKALQNSPIRRARPALLRNFIVVLVKNLFLEKHEDYSRPIKITESLRAVSEMHRKVYEERLGEALPEVVSRVVDEDLHRVAGSIQRLPNAWEALGEAQRDRLTRYVRMLPTEHFDLVESILEYGPLATAAETRVGHANIADFKNLFPFLPFSAPLISRITSLYHSADSFDEANAIAIELRYFIEGFDESQFRTLLSGIQNNNQIKGSFELPVILSLFRKRNRKISTNFENLISEYGLEKYCPPEKNEDDVIPF